MENENKSQETKEFKEITLKFGKGCVGEEFTGKDGNQYKEILIPNADKEDHRPWQTFVVKANHVHEDKFGKGVWIKLPAEGHTTIRRPVMVGETPDGKKQWDTEKRKVSNTELKKMVEFYKDKDHDSLKGKLSEKKEAVSQEKTERPKEQEKAKGAVL